MAQKWGHRSGQNRPWACLGIYKRELRHSLFPAQYRLLTALLDARGQVVSREEIIRAVWPDEDIGGISSRRWTRWSTGCGSGWRNWTPSTSTS